MNENPKQILLATDFLQTSRLALDYASALSSKFHSHLTIAHAFELNNAADEAEQIDRVPSRIRLETQARLDAFAAGCAREGVAAQTLLLQGTVQGTILEACRRTEADLLVLGTQGIHHGVEHFLLGSNTEALMYKAPCPILTVGPRVMGGIDFDIPFKKLIYVTNLRPDSIAAAPQAVRIAKRLGIAIELCHVIKGEADEKRTADWEQRVGNFCAEVGKFAAEMPAEWLDPGFHAKHMIHPETILEKTQEPQALMAIGVLNLNALQRHLRPSFPYRLLASAACPILSIRPKTTKAQA